jgi:hypothetical protein
MGLTTIGDIDILYKQVQDLKENLESKEKLKDIEYLNTVNSILERLIDLELRVFGERILLIDDSSWKNIKLKRDYLLKSTDWTVTSGSTVDQAAWVAYRQQLRDLPQTFAGVKLSEVRWPEAPSTAGPHSKKSK